MPVVLTETEIQSQILDYLKLRRIFAWRNNTRVVRIGGRLVRFGAPGSPDIIGVVNGRFLAIEVKKPGKSPTEEQERFMQELTMNGAIVIVASCVEDVDREIGQIRSLWRGERQPA